VRKTLTFLLALMLLPGLSGCTGAADSLLEEQIHYMNELADALNNGAPDSKIFEIKAKIQESGRKLQDLKLSEQEKKLLGERHRLELQRASQRVDEARNKRGVR
jgi:hypothetical protein